MSTRFLFLASFLCLLSCDDIIDLEDISNAPVEVLAPKENVILNDSNVTFSWDGLEGAEHYKLQLATPNFENAQQILEDTLLTTTNFSKVLDIGNFEWRIRAQNPNYNTEYVTQAFSVE